MPQLSKTNLMLMFVSTWATLLMVMKTTKKTNLETNQTYSTKEDKTMPWHWPYT